jgi:modulator of FtsH protease
MTANDILAWHDFMGIVAQVGATLTGLIFVGLTISLNHVLKARGYLARAFTALVLQFEFLILGLLGLVPNQPPSVLGGEFIFVGLALLLGISIFARNFPEDEQSTVLGSRGPRTIRALLTAGATLFPAIAGLSLMLGWPGAFYWLIPGVVGAIYLSVAYAWIFGIEIPRREWETTKKG